MFILAFSWVCSASAAEYTMTCKVIDLQLTQIKRDGQIHQYPQHYQNKQLTEGVKKGDTLSLSLHADCCSLINLLTITIRDLFKDRKLFERALVIHGDSEDINDGSWQHIEHSVYSTINRYGTNSSSFSYRSPYAMTFESINGQDRKYVRLTPKSEGGATGIYFQRFSATLDHIYKTNLITLDCRSTTSKGDKELLAALDAILKYEKEEQEKLEKILKKNKGQ